MDRTKARTYFCAIFNQPFADYGAWSDATLNTSGTNGEGQAAGAFLSFNPLTDRTVLVKVAISYVSVANARANLEAENPLTAFASKDFDQAVTNAGHAWNLYLNRIQVSGGTPAEMETFYSMLYRVFLGPTICSDANGDYMGYDGQVHQHGRPPCAIRQFFRLGHLPQRKPVAGHARSATRR